MTLMIIFILFVLGICLGSFVNAFVYRLHAQMEGSKDKSLSITKGRSICPHCHHKLSSADLIPIISWLILKGRCRYCKRPIHWQYPLVEALTALLFILSYVVWPYGFESAGVIYFATWLVVLTGFVALTIYDLRWMILPNRIVYPLIVFAGSLAGYALFSDLNISAIDIIGSVLISGGIFYLLFIASNGKWIGGGDVKLGILIGLILLSPSKAMLMLFLASILGSLVVIPGLVLKKISRKSRLPFGPFLMAGAMISLLFGQYLIDWYIYDFLLLPR